MRRESVRVGAWVVIGWLAIGSAAGAQPLGQIDNVQVGPAFCGTADMNLAQPYTCVELTVDCDPAEVRPVTLRITAPPVGTEVAGTVVLGLGGGGRGFYENAQRNPDADKPAAAMIDRLNLAGYRVIQRSWGDRPNGAPGGWINGSTSLRLSACRYATLMRWIFDHPQLHGGSTDTAFCASGQSGGGSEIGYGLALYGLDDVLDLAVLTGGPPHGRIDGGCDPSSMAWEDTCNQNLETLGVCPQDGPDQHTCFFSSQSIVRNVDSAFELNNPPDDEPCANVIVPTLIANGILSPLADLDHPLTNVRFLIGDQDCGTAPAMGSPYILDLLATTTGPASFDIVMDSRHTVPAFESGAAAIEAAILAPDGCVPRHGN